MNDLFPPFLYHSRKLERKGSCSGQVLRAAGEQKMAAHKNGSLIHIINRASVFFKNGSYRKRILLTSLKPVQCQRRAVSSIGDRNTNLTPHLSSNLAGWSYNELYELSVKDPETFWGSIAKERLTWNKPFDQVRDCEITSGKINWFLGGQLNVSVNCLDVHVAKHPDRVALVWERDEPGTEVKVTYRELLETTCRLANTLKRHGVNKGDRVAIYMPVSPIGVAAMLACARIGAVHTVVFAGFSSEALAGRIQDAQCKAVITCNQGVRGGRFIDLKPTVDAAVKNCPTVQHVFVAQRTTNPTPMGKLDIPLEEYVFDYHPGDVFGCVADIGWVTGHSYVVYGPLCNGATTVLFESTPVYPDPGRYWETVQRLGINQFYGAPTAIRLLLKYEESWVKKYDRSSLKTLGSVGEPINHEAWEWFYNVVGDGRCPLVDTWWQTETGGVCIAPRPAEKGAEIVPAMAMRPFFGIQPVLMEEKGKPISGNDVSGALCIGQPWPGMARTIFGDHKRFVDAYFKPYPGHYFTGDGAYRSKEGYYQITGRMDDVINISGHRLGTAEIEDALDEHPAVPETAVIGISHDIKGEVPFAFVVLKEDPSLNHTAVVKELRGLVATKIAKYAVPDHFLVVKRLPKTRSGKIMRRILRKVAMEQTGDLGDVSTLDDPSVVAEIIKAHAQYKSLRSQNT
uniref:Propionate--CoA ligase n=1 Tax=Oncorhynchus tshawytscha TaxID=74940 RepID=A0A8C8HS10_ONCTS